MEYTEITKKDVEDWIEQLRLSKPKREVYFYKFCPHLGKLISFSTRIFDVCECNICFTETFHQALIKEGYDLLNYGNESSPK